MSDIYRAEDDNLYMDVLLEAPFYASYNGENVQVNASEVNIITVGDIDYIKLMAQNKFVKDTSGMYLVVNPDNILCKLENGVPTTTNVTIIDIT